MSDFETVRYAVDEGVALITLNRPAVMNAFNGQMRRELLAAVRGAIDDDAVRVVVLTGEGRGFSAGADLADGIPPLVQQQIDEEYKPVLMAISEAPKPFISAVIARQLMTRIVPSLPSRIPRTTAPTPAGASITT